MLPSPANAATHAHRRAAAHGFMKVLLGIGLPGLFFLSIVDSSFIPLPIPGSTDIVLILLAARNSHWDLVDAARHRRLRPRRIRQLSRREAGGMHALERYVPAKYLKRITAWTERNSFLAVALPALLPPPMPLTPFMLAAGALKMSLRRYMTAFTLSRLLRHGICAWLGMHYGRAIVRTWNRFYARWDTTMMIVIWILVVVSVGVPVYAMWKESKRRKQAGQPGILREIEG